jgi:hypothetical protein
VLAWWFFRRRFKARVALRRWTFAAFLPLEMAGEKKRFELRPVDEAEEKLAPVYRLESDDPTSQVKPVRLEASPKEAKISQRLEVPVRENVEIRTHQPGIDVLIDNTAANPDVLEQEWGKDSTQHQPIAWGWFFLIAGILAGAIIWSLTRVEESDIKAREIRVTTETVLGEDEKEQLEASKLIDQIDGMIKKFFNATSVDEAARFVRHPARVRPLMLDYYGGERIPENRHLKTKLLQPVTLDNRADFYMTSVELANHLKRVVIVEVDAKGEPRIDWETLICYQPMKWDDFVTRRPVGKSLDFRVYIEQDHFFSHEFTNSERWNCFRLTALDSEETIFGYTQVDEQVTQDILIALQENQGKKASVIIRVNIPEGLQSRRGVVIEKLINKRWLYVDPPE